MTICTVKRLKMYKFWRILWREIRCVFLLSVFWIEGKLKLTRGTRNGACNMPHSCKWMHELIVLLTLRIRPSGMSSKDDVANRVDANASVWGLGVELVVSNASSATPEQVAWQWHGRR